MRLFLVERGWAFAAAFVVWLVVLLLSRHLARTHLANAWMIGLLTAFLLDFVADVVRGYLDARQRRRDGPVY